MSTLPDSASSTPPRLEPVSGVPVPETIRAPVAAFGSRKPVVEDWVAESARPENPPAGQIERTPLSHSSTNVRTHKLVRVNSGRFEFKPTWQARFFYGIFLVAGLGMMIGIPADMLRKNEFSAGAAAAVLGGALFAGIGYALLWFGSRPIVFDRVSGRYWKGRIRPAAGTAATAAPKLKLFEKEVPAIGNPRLNIANPPKGVTVVPLAGIQALQYLEKHVNSSESDYTCGELNLVLHDGSRIHVLMHGNCKALVADAQILAAFLGVPLL